MKKVAWWYKLSFSVKNKRGQYMKSNVDIKAKIYHSNASYNCDFAGCTLKVNACLRVAL